MSDGFAKFAKVIEKGIRTTLDYPKDGILFFDITTALGMNELTELVSRLDMHKGDFVLGVPTRGIPWAIKLGQETIFLHKEGVGTPLPGLVPFCAAGTSYSGDNKTKFFIRQSDLRRLQQEAQRVWIADDICESGQTIRSIYDTLQDVLPKTIPVFAIPFLAFEKSILENTWMRPFCVFQTESRIIVPGTRLFRDRPNALFTLRGSNSARGTKVYGPPSMDMLKIQYCNSNVNTTLGDIRWDLFPGGAPDQYLEPPVRGQDVVFIYDGTTFDKNQDGMVHVLARHCQGKMSVLIPNLSTGTMERPTEVGTVAAAETYLHLLAGAMPPLLNGTVEVSICTIHQTGTRFYLGDKVRYTQWCIMSTLMQKVKVKEYVVVFPDDGAWKRFKQLARFKPYAVFCKMRSGTERKLQLMELSAVASLEGRHIVIVDDLVRSGSTMMEAAKKCKDMGAAQVYCVFAHADFDPGKMHTFINCPSIDKIICSDTCYEKAHAMEGEKVKIVPLFGKSLYPGPAVIASTSSEKIRAAQLAYPHPIGFWCGSAPSYVPAQPIGIDQGIRGAGNRMRNVLAVAPKDALLLISMESSIYEDNGTYVERVDAIEEMDGKKRASNTIQTVNIPSQVFEAAKADQTKTVGSILQAQDNLPDGSAWLTHYGSSNRLYQLWTALKQFNDQ